MSDQDGRTIEQDLEHWEQYEETVKARAAAALDEDVSDEELAAVIRQLDDDMRKIPIRKRACDMAHAVGAAIAESLIDAGVKFRDPRTAPAQLGGAVFASWLKNYVEGAKDETDWLDLAAVLPEAIRWARAKGRVADPSTRRLIGRLTAKETT